MFPKISFLFAFIIVQFFAVAQITTSPALPVTSQKVTITFDSSKESRLGYYTDELYAHTGLITDKSAGDNDWRFVIGSWGNNVTQPKLTHKGNGIYDLEISPDIIAFYKVAAGEKVTKMALVFRSADSKKQTNNLFVDVSDAVIQITQPSNKTYLSQNQSVLISAIASPAASLKLYINDNNIAQANGTAISANYNFTQSGKFWIIAEAITNIRTVRDSVLIYVCDNTNNIPKPVAYKNGINYPTNNSAALVLWAPQKDSVYVIGDFNDWKPSKEYKMKKDCNYFWLDIPNLEPGKEYAFQYLIDGKIRVADPYTEKTLDPWYDRYISSAVYPNLILYPVNKTEGIVSVLQPGQEKYNWQSSGFQVPDKGKMVIYELLVRDFTAEHTYKAVLEKLDYLEDLRINVLELMPVNEFEGNSSWGYNPAFYFAPDKYYGPKNELKKLIDECHKRGIAVVIDMVLNHSYGQSPFVQMYMDNWKVTADNPWYNVKSNFQNPDAQWGYDFNHESLATQELVDSVSAFWMKEYKVDGFRFDFTKGFSNTPYPPGSWGSNYDAERISIVKRMTSEIRKRKKDAIIIFEHLSDNSEETELANYGIMLWGNIHYNYQEGARGNIGGSDLSWAIYKNRGWNSPNLVSYPESHDEERIMYVIKQSGLSSGDYNIKNQTTALKRIELNSVFNIPLPGPKMIWQFGERGYDVSINDFGGRLSEKPPYWNYLDNPDRTDLFQVMAKLNNLKQTYPEFTPESFSYDLTSTIKWYKLTSGSNHVFALGNFDILQKSATVTFPKIGKWYEFFTRDSIEISTTNQSIPLAPGEYRLYSTRKFNDPHVVTENSEMASPTKNIVLYPNPAQTEINISAPGTISEVQVYSVTGKLLVQQNPGSANQFKLNIERLAPGVYLLKVVQNNQVFTLKFVKE